MRTGEERLEISIGGQGYDYEGLSDKIVLSICHFVKGDKGDKGDVPVRGVDYWTEQDIEEFKQHCLNSLEKKWTGPESEYLAMVAAGEIHDDWTYYIYDDEEPSGDTPTDGHVVVEGDTMTVYGAVLSDEGETLTLVGTPSQDCETVTLVGSVLSVQSVTIEGDTMTVRGAALSQDEDTLELIGELLNDTLILTNN